jgi:hypothetical protein
MPVIFMLLQKWTFDGKLKIFQISLLPTDSVILNHTVLNLLESMCDNLLSEFPVFYEMYSTELCSLDWLYGVTVLKLLFTVIMNELTVPKYFRKEVLKKENGKSCWNLLTRI